MRTGSPEHRLEEHATKLGPGYSRIRPRCRTLQLRSIYRLTGPLVRNVFIGPIYKQPVGSTLEGGAEGTTVR